MPLRPRNLIDEDDPRVSRVGHPAPPWMISYADLMTELVCFFVILYALSASLSKSVQQAKQQIEQVMQEEKVQGEVKVTKDGMYITLQEQGQNVFFQSGQADLNENMAQVMDKIAPALKSLSAKHEILVEGHTDDVPTARVYASNWELSTARATSVVRYLVKERGIPPARISAVGYGEYRPLAPNDTPENRSKNRRVVFFVKNSPPPKAGGSPAASAEGSPPAASVPEAAQAPPAGP